MSSNTEWPRLQFLTQKHVDSVLRACKTPKLLPVLQAIPDNAIIELQALIWTGRSDIGEDFAENLIYSRNRFDSTTRQYLTAKWPVDYNIEHGLRISQVLLAE